MELGPQSYDEHGLLVLNAIMVVYMDPVGRVAHKHKASKPPPS